MLSLKSSLLRLENIGKIIIKHNVPPIKLTTPPIKNPVWITPIKNTLTQAIYTLL